MRQHQSFLLGGSEHKHYYDMKHIITLMLLFCLGTNGGFAQTLQTESDGFQWYELSGDNGVKGAQDKDGNILIPLSRGYTFICYHPEKGASPNGYFSVYVDHNTKCGACDIKGREIIPPKYRFVSRHGGDGEPYYFSIEDETEKEGVCDMSGKEIFPTAYKSILYMNGYFKFKKTSSDEYTLTNITLNKDGIASGVYNAADLGSSDNNSYSSSSTSQTSSTVRELFEEAYNTPDSETQLKFDRYQKVLQADPNNKYGYNSLVYNNIGCIYHDLGDTKNAKDYYEAALRIDPNNSDAKSNLKSIKSIKRRERWNNFVNALDAISKGLQNGSGSQPEDSYNSYQGSGSYNSSNSGNSGSGGSSVDRKKCSFCAGSGRCSGSGRCRGHGKCDRCNGNGYDHTAGNLHKCGACNGTGKCPYCRGTGKCNHCNGSGYAH